MYCFWISRYFSLLRYNLYTVKFSLSSDFFALWQTHTAIRAQPQWRRTAALSSPRSLLPASQAVLPLPSFHSLPLVFFFPPLKFCLCSNITNGSIRSVIFSVWLFGTVHLRFIHYYMFCYFVPFLLLSSVLLNGFTSLLVGLPFSQLRDIWIIYSFGWLWIKLPNIFAQRLLCEHRLSFHLGK